MSEGTRATVQGSRQGALWLATLGFFGGFAGVAVFGPMVPEFVEILGLSPVQAGLLAGIPNLTGSLLRIPFGAWWTGPAADALPVAPRAHTRRYGGAFGGVGNLLPGRHGRVVSGASGARSFDRLRHRDVSVGISQVSYWFPQRQQVARSGSTPAR